MSLTELQGLESFKKLEKLSKTKKDKPEKLEQKKIYNSIVKIITTMVEYDNLMPYNIKNQEKSVGAGFFIDNKERVLLFIQVHKLCIEHQTYIASPFRIYLASVCLLALLLLILPPEVSK